MKDEAQQTMKRIKEVLANSFPKIICRLVTILKKVVLVAGFIFLIMLALSFTDYPYHAYHWLGTSLVEPQNQKPDYIVLLGAGSVPGNETLLRIYYTAEIAKKFPSSKIIAALPSDSLDFQNSDHQRMVHELVKAGIDSSRIISETRGSNTYSQSHQIFKLIGQPHTRLLIVTSPEHIYRSILTFKKTGFTHLNGQPAFEGYFDESLLMNDPSEKQSLRKPGQNLSLRYNMWSYLQYEIKVLREIAALSYYQLKGYI
jgi:uncharacterized SAM-binding protein YcdF (DUF218 family)